MDFVSNKVVQIKAMLKAIGIKNVDELFREIPSSLRVVPPLSDDGLSEMEGMKLMESLGAKNKVGKWDLYLGGGAYEHHIPALVSAICSKSEFLTSYTPYQAEASQGTLQIIFEFQSAICALTGMDVANASVYDGANACAEGCLMALRHHKNRKKIIVAQSLHPHYRAVVNLYLDNLVRRHGIQIETISLTSEGQIDRKQYIEALNETTAGVLIQSPNFLGALEDVPWLVQEAKKVGALTILCANPLVYGLYASAKEMGVDIAVGDMQPFGLSLQYGGPYAGYMSCRQEWVRQLPGRIVGETVDLQGRRGFVLTLQAREQHIRREKATSNICTNQNLAALASLITLLWYGKEGLAKLALTNYQRAAYLRQHLLAIPGITGMGDSPFLNEFVVFFSKPLKEVVAFFREKGIEPGLDLNRFYPSLKQGLLVAVTEMKTKEQLNTYINLARRLMGLA